jgi:hypothetical protein
MKYDSDVVRLLLLLKNQSTTQNNIKILLEGKEAIAILLVNTSCLSYSYVIDYCKSSE